MDFRIARIKASFQSRGVELYEERKIRARFWMEIFQHEDVNII